MNKPNCTVPFIPNAQNALDAPALLISSNNWNFPDAPKTYAHLAFDGKDLLITLVCKEHDPYAVFTENYQDVYKDSCMECFLCFDPQTSPRYVNVETNSNGAIICCTGEGRENRKRVIDEYGMLPRVKAEKFADYWMVNLRLSREFIKTLFGITLGHGTKFKGNFYKCQQDGNTENYLSWAPIDTPKPDFHRPEFFGDITIA